MKSNHSRDQSGKIKLPLLLVRFFLLLVVLVAAGCASSRPPTSGKTIRIMTWNIHHAEGTDHQIDVDRIAKLIRSESPDVVALQEVDRGVERTKKIDIITMLADKTDMTYAFGKTIDFQGGEYGNAILTRFPILEEHDVKYTKNLGREQRGLMQLIFDVRGNEVLIANTHLDDQESDSTRAATIEELGDALKAQRRRPVILCGDLNITPSSGWMTTLSKDFTDATSGQAEAYTYPSDKPNKRIDYILVLRNQKPDSLSSSVRIRPLVSRVLQSSASDHLPLVVELELQTE